MMRNVASGSEAGHLEARSPAKSGPNATRVDTTQLNARPPSKSVKTRRKSLAANKLNLQTTGGEGGQNGQKLLSGSDQEDPWQHYDSVTIPRLISKVEKMLKMLKERRETGPAAQAK